MYEGYLRCAQSFKRIFRSNQALACSQLSCVQRSIDISASCTRPGEFRPGGGGLRSTQKRNCPELFSQFLSRQVCLTQWDESLSRMRLQPSVEQFVSKTKVRRPPSFGCMEEGVLVAHAAGSTAYSGCCDLCLKVTDSLQRCSGFAFSVPCTASSRT